MKDNSQNSSETGDVSTKEQKQGFFKRLKEKISARRFAHKSKKLIKTGVYGVGQEAVETKEMAQSFYKLLESKLDIRNRKEPPSKEEVKAAIAQLKDVGRFSIFATISILPGGGVSLIGLELLAKKLGVKNFTFVPSAFKKENQPEYKD